MSEKKKDVPKKIEGGYQPVKKGYQPVEGNLNPEKPPKGESGVPPKTENSSKNPENDKQ
jgi:hypothetical protein